jgi:hypothetical protein
MEHRELADWLLESILNAIGGCQNGLEPTSEHDGL